MTPTIVDEELRVLRDTVRILDAKFLAAHLPSSGLEPASEDEQLDVAAFIVLVHGALEEFVEGLASPLNTLLVERWTLSRGATAGTSTLVLHEKPPAIDSNTGVFDMLRIALEQAGTAMSRAIWANNGITPKHLANLFHPLGVDIPRDPILVAQMELLVKWRHQWAHRNRYGAKVVKSAADARKTAGDCVRFAEELGSSVRAAWP